MCGEMPSSASNPLTAPATPITVNSLVLVIPLKCLSHLTDSTMLLLFLSDLSGDRSLLRC